MATPLSVIEARASSKKFSASGEGTEENPYKWNQDVFIQDQATEVVDLLLGQILDTVTVLSPVTLFDTTIDIETTGHVPTHLNDEFLCLKEDLAFNQTKIIGVTLIAGNQYTLTLDTPLDYAFGVESGCSVINVNMAVDGSTTPVVFAVSPADLTPTTQWDITRILGSMTHSGTPDDGKFGGIAALTKGVYSRVVNGTVKNGFNAKTNGEFALRMYDVAYASAPPTGLEGTRFRRSINGPDKNGVVLRLDGAEIAEDAAQLQIVIQDDLTGIATFYVVVQGHVVDE